jgi:large subunit ribosomal protein L35
MEKGEGMPKMKTDRGAAKRIRVTGTGRLRRRKANRSHLLEKKASTRTRRLARETEVAKGDARSVRRMLGL